MLAKKVFIIDLASGNIHSLAKAFESLGCIVKISDNYQDIISNDYIVLPGQGAFPNCSGKLMSLGGMHEALNKEVFEKSKPFLGVCVGMELLADVGFEHHECLGLGYISGTVEKIKDSNEETLKIPHIGWNQVEFLKDNPFNKSYQLCKKQQNYFYFAHSYYFKLANEKHLLAKSKYGIEFPSVIIDNNLVGCQFHPEKSSKAGLVFLEEFLNL